jgi:hypothetical protein
MLDFQKTPDYHGYIEINLNSALIGFTTLFYGTRMYVRAFMTKSLSWDDAFATIAYMMLVVQSSLDIHGEQDLPGGLNNPPASFRPN